MNLLLVVPDGVGVRNFLLGRFCEEAERRCSVQVLHAIPDDLVSGYSLNGSGGHRLASYVETPLSFTLRYALHYGQMYWVRTQAMTYNLRRPVRGSWRTRSAHQVARRIGRIAASPAGLKWLDGQHVKAVGKTPATARYRRVLQDLKPDVVFCTHQRPPSAVPLVVAAREAGIPSATFIFSWDNITSKGRIAAPYDHYFVWSALMRDEVLRYYPDVSPDRVHVVGTPQFDAYADETIRWPRDEFFRRIGADPARPLVCFSGGDIGTCPEDQDHVRVLMELIRNGQILGNPQVLVRPAPVDDARRYEAVRRAYPEMIFARPEWVHASGDWSQVFPTADDVQFLANLTRHADINVNVASTMTLDFAIHDKPVVNIGFDVSGTPPHGVPLANFFYDFEHYRPVVELGAARLARSPKELADHVNRYLDDPALDREGRRRLVELEVGVPPGESSSRIVDALQRIAR